MIGNSVNGVKLQTLDLIIEIIIIKNFVLIVKEWLMVSPSRERKNQQHIVLNVKLLKPHMTIIVMCVRISENAKLVKNLKNLKLNLM